MVKFAEPILGPQVKLLTPEDAARVEARCIDQEYVAIDSACGQRP